MATRISVTVLRTAVSAIKAGPVTLRVAARERLISVTVALFEGNQLVAENIEFERKNPMNMN